SNGKPDPDSRPAPAIPAVSADTPWRSGPPDGGGSAADRSGAILGDLARVLAPRAGGDSVRGVHPWFIALPVMIPTTRPRIAESADHARCFSSGVDVELPRTTKQ